MLLDEEVLTEGMSERKIKRMQNILKNTYSPYDVVHRKSRKTGVAFISSLFGAMCAALFGLGWFQHQDPVNADKLKFKLELVQNDSECMHWAKECEDACDSYPPDKEKAKYAYKKFKEAFKALDHERKWKQYKRENK